MNKVVVKLVKSADIMTFEKSIEKFYNEYMDNYSIECHYSSLKEPYHETLLIAKLI